MKTSFIVVSVYLLGSPLTAAFQQAEPRKPTQVPLPLEWTENHSAANAQMVSLTAHHHDSVAARQHVTSRVPVITRVRRRDGPEFRFASDSLPVRSDHLLFRRTSHSAILPAEQTTFDSRSYARAIY